MKKMHTLLAAGFGLCFSAMTASAGAISVGTWYDFSFGGTGSALGDGSSSVDGTNPATTDAPAAPWTFTLSSPGQLFVTDIFQSGDEFQLFDSVLGSLGFTSDATQGSNVGSDIGDAIADLNFSRGVFLLAAGSYSITGIVTNSPFGGGGGAFQVSQVPIPAALPLLAAGLGALGYMKRRQKRKAAAAA